MTNHRDLLADARDRLRAANLLGAPVRGIEQANRGAALIIRLTVLAPIEQGVRERIAEAMKPLWYEIRESEDDPDGRRPGVSYRA